MTQPQQTMLQCSNCGTPNPVALRRVIDAKKDPQGKAALINGRVNSFRCQNCGTVNMVSSPLLYHDADKELLIALVPMDVALRQKVSEEKMVGDLMNELTASLPKEAFRAYMFNPKRALTLQGLIEQVLEADGISKEMVEDQKKRVELVQTFMDARSEEDLVKLVETHDKQIDLSVFQTLSLMAQRVMQEGQRQLAGHLLAIQQVMLEHSSFGKELAQKQQAQEAAIQDVAQRLEQLGESVSRADVMELVFEFADDDDKLQALVGLARAAMDYDFFLQFSEQISKAPAADRDKLETLRDSLRELTEQIDAQSRIIVQQKAQFLQALLNSPNYEALLSQNIAMLDDNFLTVLSANLQEAERRQDLQIAAKLRTIYEKTLQLLQSQMTPELRFINELLSTESEEAMTALIDERAADYGEELLEVVDAVESMFQTQGHEAAIERLRIMRAALEKVLN